ncbi:hypothetical protein DPMN_046664 [Dreissena polymorpha]|uniref:ANK_REP_REGION domain-containing protein n=1 Tax=Dreissena polymorpha TaxID=45954 RepID=A0A9D4I134_DREPO|nr:hypothetical protein DPMN_046664 [Dreissena polymorpha]
MLVFPYQAQDVQRMSPLHTAVCQSHSDIVRQLLKAGADARSKDEDLSTPLHEAATIGNTIIGSLIFDNCVLADGTPDVDKEASHFFYESRSVKTGLNA